MKSSSLRAGTWPAAARLVVLFCIFIMVGNPVARGGTPPGDGTPVRMVSAEPCDSVNPSPYVGEMVIFESSVSINGGGNSEIVLTNDSFTVSFDYYIQVCPNTTQNFCQVVVGFPNLPPQLCVYRKRVTCDGEVGNLTFKLRAPGFPSQYLIAFDVKRTSGEPGCPTAWPNGPPPPSGYLGCVRVTEGNVPIPVTGYADNVTGTSATLHGQVNPSGFATTARFVYGTVPGVYTDSVTTFESPVNGTTLLAVSGAIGGLTPNTTYYYRATAENVNGYQTSTEKSLFTGPKFALAESEHSFGYVPLYGSKTDSITVLNGGNVTLSITSAVALGGPFYCAPSSGSVPPLGSKRFAVTFQPGAYGRITSGILFQHGAAGSPDTQLVSGVVPIGGVLAGWNVISVPLTTPDPRKSVLFPEAVSNAFGFNTMYVAAETLRYGKGYWLKFPATDSMAIPGQPRAIDSTDVNAGWNIIGVPSFPVPIDSVSTVPPGIITGNFFEYAYGYAAASLLRPGKGYWVKVSQPGVVRLSGDLSGIAPAPPPAAPEGSVRLRLTDADGESRQLTIGPAGPGEGFEDVEAPPPPPAGIFDARFAGNRLAASPGRGPGSGVALELRDAAYPVSMTWTAEVAGAEMVVGDRRIDLGGPGEAIIGQGERVVFRSIQAGSAGPAAESRITFGNYPNPFNPSTVISFSLPEGGMVGLEVFNVLGGRVFRMEEKFMGAGTHEVSFDASDLPAGVYVARMNAGRRAVSLKMLLVR